MNIIVKNYMWLKSESKYSCASALYFELDKQIIKENCIFDYYFNKTDV